MHRIVFIVIQGCGYIVTEYMVELISALCFYF